MGDFGYSGPGSATRALLGSQRNPRASNDLAGSVVLTLLPGRLELSAFAAHVEPFEFEGLSGAQAGSKAIHSSPKGQGKARGGTRVPRCSGEAR
jgi:hypothetical protein